MKSITDISRFAVIRFAILLQILYLPSFAISAAADKSQLQQALVSNKPAYSAVLGSQVFNGQVDSSVSITLNIAPFPAPAGRFYSILADILEKPVNAKVETLSGYQSLQFTADKAGVYRLQIVVNIMGKSSCGGIHATELMRKEVLIQLE